MSCAINFILGTISSQLADSGLANALGVETLKHGTTIFSYLNIRWHGGMPKYESLSSKLLAGSFKKDNSNYFYVFKENISFNTGLVFPRSHMICSSTNVFEKQFPSDSFLGKSLIALAIVINVLVTPIINFRYRKEEIAGRFESDLQYRFGKSVESSIAYKTKEKSESWRIGFLGSILVGANASWLNRMKENPWRLAKGISQLVGSSLLSWYAGHSIRTISFVAGFILA